MDEQETNEQNPPGGPRLVTVLITLAAFALIGSYLAVYAVPNALVAADLLAPWPPEADPRTRWLVNAFAGSFATFAAAGVIFRWMSNRQLRRIDAIAEGE